MTASSIRERLLENIRVRVPGVLDSVVKLELFNVLDELCHEARMWREKIQVRLVSGKAEYEVDPSDGIIIGLTALLNEADRQVPASMPVPGVITLMTTPSEPAVYVADVALTVDRLDRDGFPVIDDWVWERHFNTIMEGVLSALMSQPAKPYTNERLSVLHGRRFKAGAALARVHALHEHLYRGQSWRFPGFAQGGRR